MSADVPLQACPCCGCPIDRATHAGPGEVAPMEGDLSVCFYCAAALQYGAGLRLQPVDVATLPAGEQADMRKVIAGVRAMLARARP